MKTIQKLIHAGFASCALASASMPALSWTVWPNVDFEWYADVGKPLTPAGVEVFPAPREGYIWSPGHYERTTGNRERYVPGRWIADDYPQQVARYSLPPGAQIATGPVPLYDSQGNPIPTSPSAYPVESATRR